MASHSLSCLGTAAVVLTLLGCSGSDLTLPGPGPAGPDQPAALKVLSGDDQRADVGTVLDDPLTVQVLDGQSEPVPGVRVQFSFLGEASGAALDPATIETDEAGRAEATVRLGELPGEQIIVAAVASTELPELRAQFSATALASDDGNDGKDGKGHGKGGEGDD
jgi:hypothetical protein